MTDEELEAMPIEQRNALLDAWIDGVADAVWFDQERYELDLEEAQHREELSRDRWTY